MGLSDFLYGKPPETSIYQAPGTRAPMFGFGRAMGDYLTGLIGQPAPAYQGRLDPGLSPTMQMLSQLLQGRAMHVPEVIGGAAGGLPGGYMAAFRPPPAFDPAGAYSFAFKPPSWGDNPHSSANLFRPQAPMPQQAPPQTPTQPMPQMPPWMMGGGGGPGVYGMPWMSSQWNPYGSYASAPSYGGYYGYGG